MSGTDDRLKGFETSLPGRSAPLRLWTLSADRKLVRLQLPPVHLAGSAKPLDVHLEFDARSVDAILQRLAELRVQMLPPPNRN